MRNLKKVIALVAVFAMLVSTVAFAQTYSDVAETDTYAEAIETLTMLGILTGDDADNDGQMDFRPADTITRAEVAAIVCRIQGMNSAAQVGTSFTDVPSSHWASGYIAQAAGQGIVNGYGDGNFGPDDNVKYEQVLKMLMETLGYNIFATDNGGYPTGYITAAQRYGVLEGVVGGAVDAEANRGMVAQMVFNAIDTPLMDKYSYGADAQYMIYDGSNGLAYMTLMTRDLKILKATGTVTENSYSGGVDLDKVKTIELTLDDADVNYNYMGYNPNNQNETGIRMFDQGEVDADAYLGYAVNVYAKDSVAGNDTLIAIAKDSSRNAEVSYAVDEYKEIATNRLTFEDDNGSKKTVNVTAANTAGTVPTILFNGITAGNDLSNFFGKNIVVNNNLNGKVTFVDTASTAGYELVKIDIATPAVVRNVASNGQVTFHNSVMLPELVSGAFTRTGNLSYLKFDDEATDVIINLTKGGEAIDWTELKEWDVLSIVAERNSNVYNVSVLAEDNYVDAYVTAVRTDGRIALSDGNLYEVASNGYLVTGLEPGDTGRFYIDAYGKLVALDDDVVVEGVEINVADNYAIVLNAQEDDGLWGKTTVIAQILDKTGAIYEAALASSVDFENLNVVDDALAATLAGSNDPADKADINGYDMANITAPDAAKLAAALTGKMISYTANSAGNIKAVTFAQTASEDEDLYQDPKSTPTTASAFDPEDMEINGVEIDEDTYVFYMTNAVTGGSVVYGDATNTASADYSRVGTGADLAEGSYKFVAFDTVEGAAKAIVVLNTAGEIAPSANVAVIDGIGTTVSNSATVYVVDYYMNGELKQATTAEDLTTLTTATAARGDVFQINVSNGIITNAAKLFDYNRAVGTAMTDINTLDGNGTGVIFGAVQSKTKSSNNLQLSNGQTIRSRDAETANVYVLDPNVSVNGTQLYTSSIAAAYVDEYITENIGKNKQLKVDYDDATATDTTITLDTISKVYGLMDYAFAYQYEGDAIDIVIYKAYEFGYDVEDVPQAQ